jgi:PAS domain S-box-containing protein
MTESHITTSPATRSGDGDHSALAQALAATAGTPDRALDLVTVLDQVLAGARQVVPFDGANVHLLDEGGETGRLVRTYGYEEQGLNAPASPAPYRLADFKLYRRMLETQEPVVVHEAQTHPDWMVCPNMAWIRSYLGVPLRVREDVIGFLNLDSARPRFFTAAHVEQVQALAEHAAVAIQNARLYAGLEAQRQTLEQKMRERTAELEQHVALLQQEVAARRAAEAALRTSEEKYRGVVQQSQDGIALTDEQGILTEWNRALAELTGVPAAEALGRPIWDVQFQLGLKEKQTPELYQRLKGMIEQTLADGEAPWLGQLEEREYRHPNGERRFLQNVGFAVQTEQGWRLGSITRDVTAGKRAQAALRESEAQYRLVVENATDTIFQVDREGNFLMLNRAAAAQLGGEPQDFVGKTMRELFPHHRAESQMQSIRQVIDTQQGMSIAAVSTIVQGETRFYSINLQPIIDAEGHCTSVQGLAHDVTQHKRVEEAVTEERERLETVLSALNTGLSLINPDMTIAWVNRKIREMFPGREPVGQVCHAFYESRSTPCDDCVTGLAFETGRVQERERFNPVDGRWYYIIAQPIQDERGRVVNVLEGITDITERKETERARRASEERYRLLVENSPLGVVVVDRSGHIAQINRKFVELMGSPTPDFTGSINVLTFPPIVQSGIAADFKSCLETGEPVVAERPYASHWGKEVHLRYHLTPLRDEQGAIVAVQAVAEDVTQRKRAERALTRSNQDLTQFAHAVSHDLQAPLRAVSSYLGLLKRRHGDQLSEDARDYVRSAVAASERMRHLITDMLDYSRLSTRAKEFVAVDCEEVLEAVLGYLRFNIEESGAQVTHDPLPTVWADETQLLQLFQNLIGNALKFRGEADARVHVSARQEERVWLFSVQDNGIGIDPNQVERIFGVFQRLHARDEYEGSGIGLAICKRIVERHGGRIWVESAPGEGATFYFTLPVDQT